MTLLLAVACAAAMTGCKFMKKKIQYPSTRQDTTVVDDYFGTLVADPYRWLEDDNSPETARWVAAQNEVTQRYIASLGMRGAIHSRLTELWDFQKEEPPLRVGDYYFYLRNDGLQPQSVLYIQDIVRNTPPEVFLDPNTLSENGTVALSTFEFCGKAKKMAYTVSSSGSDWAEIRVREVESRKDLDDVIRWVKFPRICWVDGGFYYNGYDEPDTATQYSGKTLGQKVFYHKLGTPQSQDMIVYEDPAHPQRYNYPWMGGDKRYLFVEVSEGTSGSQILFRDLGRAGSPWRTALEGFKHEYVPVACNDGKLFVHTNFDAPNYRVARVDLSNLAAAPVDVIPESAESTLESVTSAGRKLMAIRMEKASNRAAQYDMQGKKEYEIPVPPFSTVAGLECHDPDAPDTFFSVSNFLTPKTIYRYDMDNGSSTLYSKPEVSYDPDMFTARQVSYPSKDGTMVSMFLVHRKDIKQDGQNPVLLYGYGGFSNPVKPTFNPNNLMFMEQGGVYAVPNLRGGSEYGEKWHEGGMLANKQNVFDDFIAAAEWLIAEKYTTPSHLAIYGGSNGGLLVGACMTQRPELYAVAIPAVGVMDMLRYHRFTVGWGWAVEYGSSDDPAQFGYIYKYSPLHNLRKGVCYPATLVLTADHDDRVVPAHSFKFAATLQAAQGCDNPTLIRIDTSAGHGAGKPTSKRIDEAADMFSFIFANTGTEVKFPAGK